MPKAQFAREADMLEPLTQRARDLIDIPGKVFYEVQSTSGIPDVVLVSFDNASVTKRRARGQGPILDLPDMSVLLCLSEFPGKTFTPTQISRRVSISPGYISSIVLPRLASTGHVEKKQRGQWAARNEFTSLAERITTVEVKIRDWKGGYRQTLRHSLAADEAWLVIDSEVSTPARAHQHWFASAGIGLATLHSQDGLERLVEPQKRRNFVRNIYRELLVERAAHLCANGQVSGPIHPVFGADLTTSRGLDPRRPNALALQSH